METIGIVGGGIVGSVAGYYLQKNGYQVTLFDQGEGQATRASAGIICPWFTLRRNKPWYFLVSQGAEFYRTLMHDLGQEGVETASIFKEVGAIIIRKNEQSLQRDLAKAEEKREASPSIKAVRTLSSQEIKNAFPLLETSYQATFVEGGAKVDGRILIEVLHNQIRSLGGQIINERASLLGDGHIKTDGGHGYQVDKCLLAPGAWLPKLLMPLGYEVLTRPQKGQLVILEDSTYCVNDWPVVMPPGKIDIIPNEGGKIVIGATHEDDMDFDLEIDQAKIDELVEIAMGWIPQLKSFNAIGTRVGTRSYTLDYSTLVGRVPGMEKTWVVSGLGSSGLTAGPFIGYQWYKLISEGQWEITDEDFPIEHHIKKTKK